MSKNKSWEYVTEAVFEIAALFWFGGWRFRLPVVRLIQGTKKKAKKENLRRM